MVDEGTEFGARVARHLREEMVVWLTTVTPSGAPLPRPVGFLWDGGENVFVYSQPGARVRNIDRNPKVTLNFRGDANGSDIVILSGTAQVDESRPTAGQDPAWVAKYATECERAGMTADSFSERFSIPVRMHQRRPRVLSTPPSSAARRVRHLLCSEDRPPRDRPCEPWSARHPGPCALP